MGFPKVHIVEDIDLLPSDAEVCRDEDCPVIDVHLAHPVHVRRGRPTAACPNCFKSLTKTTDAQRTVKTCGHCGWSRSKEI